MTESLPCRNGMAANHGKHCCPCHNQNQDREDYVLERDPDRDAEVLEGKIRMPDFPKQQREYAWTRDFNAIQPVKRLMETEVRKSVVRGSRDSRHLSIRRQREAEASPGAHGAGHSSPCISRGERAGRQSAARHQASWECQEPFPECSQSDPTHKPSHEIESTSFCPSRTKLAHHHLSLGAVVAYEAKT